MTKTSLLIEATPDTRTKKCSECGRVLPISEFHKKKNSKDGYQAMCRSCKAEYGKAWYAMNKNKRKKVAHHA